MARALSEEAEAFEDAQASQTSQSTLLLQKKKLMEEAQIELDRKQEEIRLRMLRCQEKEDELALTQADLREQVVKFEKFLKDNDAKRLRAHRKALDEIKQREEKAAARQQAEEQAERHGGECCGADCRRSSGVRSSAHEKRSKVLSPTTVPSLRGKVPWKVP